METKSRKPNLSMLRRPDVLTETRTFTDPTQPGQEITLTMTAVADYSATAKRDELAQELTETYITGDWLYIKSEGKEGKSPAVISFPGFVVTPSKKLCWVTASLITMENETLRRSDDYADLEPYDAMEWFALSCTMPLAFEQIVEWCQDMRVRVTGAVSLPN